MPQKQLLLPKTLFVLHLTFTMFLQPDRPHARFEGHLEKRQAFPLSSTKVVFFFFFFQGGFPSALQDAPRG